MEIRGKKQIVNATIIVNPISGKGDSIERRKLIKELATELGWVGKYIETTKEISATEIAKKEVKSGVKHIVACGGDGTIMMVLEAMIDKDVVLGIIPLGTANILARNLSIPLETKEAMSTALYGNRHQIDVGQANKNYFCIIAGIGVDADVMRTANRKMKDKWGLFAYFIASFKSLNNKSGKFEITLDNKESFTVKAKTILASNMGKLMGGLEIVPEADPRSGSLQLGIIKARSFKAWVSIIIHALTGRIDSSNHYDIYTAKKIEISLLNGKKYYQCDGDHFPPTDHLSITIFPKAVNVMVPTDIIDEPEELSKKVMLFDFDGTLADSIKLFETIYNDLSRKYKFPTLSVEEIERLRGMSAISVIRQLPISKIKLPFIYAEGKKEFKKNLEFVKPFEGMSNIISSLSKKYTLGLVTSNDPTNVKKFLLKHNMDYFDFVYSDGSLFGKGKILNDVVKKYKFKKRTVVYVGDEVRDIDAAREAGIRVVSVTWGFNSKKVLKENNPTFVIENQKDLVEKTFFS